MKTFFSKCLIFIVMYLPFGVFAQQHIPSNFINYGLDSLTSIKSAKGYAPSLFRNLGEQAVSPFHFTAKEWIVAGTTIGVTGLFIGFDSKIDKWVLQKGQRQWINYSSPMVTQLGGPTGIYAVGAYGLFSGLTKNNKGVQTSLLATQAMITSGVWTHIIKILTLRERPDQTYLTQTAEGGKWYGPRNIFNNNKTKYNSILNLNAFPSGHTATIYSIATVIASQYKDQKAIPIISYTLASLVGISRLTEHQHWASDVFFGAVLGYVCGKQVVSHFNKTHIVSNAYGKLKNPNKTEISLFENGDEIGVRLSWR